MLTTILTWLLALLTALFPFFGTANTPEPLPAGEKQLLVDYYEATVATVGGDHYTELVLYLNPDGSYEVDLFAKYEDEPETCTIYPADASYYEAVLEVIRNSKMAEWNDTDYLPGMTGKVYACRFLLDGVNYRVSSDNMPEDGMKALYEINGILSRALTD